MLPVPNLEHGEFTILKHFMRMLMLLHIVLSSHNPLRIEYSFTLS